MKLLVISAIIITTAFGRKGFGPTDQEWGYVTVREGAHIFWWLHKTAAKVEDYTEKPVVIWLQGGPGASSTGYGNFAEIGPLDADLNLRSTTWINDVNLIFVDNPVGTGYSYVDDFDKFAKTNREIAEDFVVLVKGIYETLPELKKAPLYIFSESYGGKMAVEIALLIDQGAVDQNGYEKIQLAANKTRDAIVNEQWTEATSLWRSVESTMLSVTSNIDIYNVLNKVQTLEKNLVDKFLNPAVKSDTEFKISQLMNNEVKEALGLEQTWGSQSFGVFWYLNEDFMKPVTDVVELLLNTTNLQIVVYNGQLDLIVDTPGTMTWIDALKFPQAALWSTAIRKVLVVDKIVEGYLKKAGNLTVYWVDRSGHMVAVDNPAAMKKILSDVMTHFT